MPERYSDRADRESYENRPQPGRRKRATIAATAIVAVAATAILVPRALEKDDRVIGAPSDTAIPSDISGPPSLKTPSQKDHVPNISLKVGDKITVCDGTFVDSQQTSEGRRVNQAINRPAVNKDGDPYFQVHGNNSGDLTLQGLVAEKFDYWLDVSGERINLPLCEEQTYQGVVLGVNAGPFATTNKDVLDKDTDKGLRPNEVCTLGGFAILQNVHSLEQAAVAAKTCS